MGTKNIELGSGTIQFGDGDPIPVKDFKITESSELEPDENITKILRGGECSCTITGTINFKSYIKLFGFWRALRYKLHHLFRS